VTPINWQGAFREVLRQLVNEHLRASENGSHSSWLWKFIDGARSAGEISVARWS
jgi:hypothetical protein